MLSCHSAEFNSRVNDDGLSLSLLAASQLLQLPHGPLHAKQQ